MVDILYQMDGLTMVSFIKEAAQMVLHLRL